MTETTSTRRVSLVPVAIVAGSGLAAGLEFHRVFGLGDVILPVLVASTVPAAIAVIGARRRLHVGLSIAISAVAAILCSAIAVFPDLAAGGVMPNGAVVRAIGDATINGWARLVTTTLPADPDPDLIFLPFALTWVAVAAGAEMVERSRARLAALGPAIGVFVVGAVAGAGGSGSTVAVAIALIALAAVMASLRADDRRSEPATARPALTPRALVGGVSIILVVVLVAVAIGPHAPGVARADPYDPRDSVEPDILDREAVDPLALLSSWTARPDDVLFEGNVDQPIRWRLAVLDQWNGSAWSSDAVYGSVGTVIPPAPGAPAAHRTDQVHQSVSIRDLDTPWLPVADRPSKLLGQDVVVDVDTGVVLAPEGSAAAGDYDTISDVPVRDAKTTNSAPTGSADGLLDVPELPTQISDLATKITSSANATSPYQRALLLEQYLHDHSTFDPKARSGHSYLRIKQVLGFPVDDSGPRGKATPGTSEQFAVAFALMARSIGLPTRIAVGFHAGRQLAGDRYTVHSGDAFGWPEVLFDGVGWVAFDPTPQAEGEPPPPEQDKPEKIDQDADDDALVDLANDPSQPSSTGGSKKGTAAAPDTGPPWVLIATGALVLLAAAYVLAIAVVRRRRRSRLQRGSADEQVLGAWTEIVKVLELYGLRASSASTTTEVLDRVGAASSISTHDAVMALRGFAVRAAYSGQASETQDAAEAWTHVDAVERSLSSDLPWLRRVLRRLSPQWFVPARPGL